MLRRFALLLALAALPASSKPLNVVLIMADDVGYECFGAYGSKQYKTPRLDKLADTGVKFTHCYSTPLCTPSRVAIMTGKSNVRNYADFGALIPGERTFADVFRDAGYATAIAGKWQLQGNNRVKGVPAGHGFDSHLLWNTPITERRRFWNPSLDLNGEIMEVQENDYGPDLMAEFLLDFIEENKDKPFLAYYPMVLVHTPFVPTPASADRESKDIQKNFEDMVAYMDHIVGRFEDKLDEFGLAGNTLLIFTGDNGSHHNLYSKLDGKTIRGDKGAPTEAGTHVPMFIKAPGIVPGGRVVDDLIDFVDVLPTVAEAADLDIPPGIDGRSFWQRLTGKKGDPRDWHYTYYFPRPYAEKFNTPYANPEIRYMRDKRYKLYGNGELFDVVADPSESSPLASHEAADTRGRLNAALDSMPRHGAQIPEQQWDKSAGAPRPRWE